jgi:hypothetical protein
MIGDQDKAQNDSANQDVELCGGIPRDMIRHERSTVRRIMVIVAAVAMLLGGEQMRRRYQFCHQLAVLLDEQEKVCLRGLAHNEQVAADFERKAEESRAKLKAGKPDDEVGQWLYINEQHIMEECASSATAIRENAKQWRERAAKFADRRKLYHQASLRPWMAIPTELTLPLGGKGDEADY